MLDVLKLLVAIAIFLGVVIAAGLGYSHREKVILEQTVGVAQNEEGAGFGGVEISNSNVGTRQMAVRGYGKVRNIIVFKASLGGRKELTEREIVDAAKKTPILRSVGDRLERTYRTYERVRFGSHHLTNEECESFLRELQEVSARIQ